MKSSLSPSEQEYSIKDSGYFHSTISISGRQRTPQACDKCRERKTKCSGEKPVCQRCTSRGLICEYSYREPRVRGPARARITPSTTAFPTKDLPLKSYPISIQSRQDIDYSQSPAPRRNHQPPEYFMDSSYPVNSVVSRNHDSTPPYLGAEPKSYSEPRALHLSHWADVRRSSSRNYAGSNLGLISFGLPQLPHISATARVANTGVMGYDPHSAVQQPMKRQEALFGCVPNSSSFLLEAQQSPQYNDDLHRHGYSVGDYRTLEYPLPSSPDGSCNGYQSSSAVSSSTPTPPFYPLDHLDHSMEIHGRPMAHGYNGESFEKRGVYAEEDTANPILDFSYTNSR